MKKLGASLSVAMISLSFAGCGQAGFYTRSISAPALFGPETGSDIGFKTSDDAIPEEGDDLTGLDLSEANTYPMEYGALWDGKHPDAIKWTRATVLAIERYGHDMLANEPSDIKSYCPQFSLLKKEEKIAFWVHMISAIAQKESDFNPTKPYVETFTDKNGERVVSRGLLQLSLESVNNPLYGCKIKKAEELDDPLKNLVCGVKILNHWMRTEPVITRNEGKEWLGAAKYWGVLRTSDTVSFIKNATSDLPICGVDRS